MWWVSSFGSLVLLQQSPTQQGNFGPSAWLTEPSLANTRRRETWSIQFKKKKNIFFYFLQALKWAFFTSLPAWCGLGWKAGQMHVSPCGCHLKKAREQLDFLWPSWSQVWADQGLWRDKAAHAGAVGLQILLLAPESLGSCDLGGTRPGPRFPTLDSYWNPLEAQSDLRISSAEGQHVFCTDFVWVRCWCSFSFWFLCNLGQITSPPEPVFHL